MNDISLTDFNSMTTADYINGYNWEYSSRSWFGRVNYALRRFVTLLTGKSLGFLSLGIGCMAFDSRGVHERYQLA